MLVPCMEPTTERGKRLAGLAAQLRELHAALADENGEMRSEQLRDRVMREVNHLPSHEREGFLAELLGHFPVWSDGGGGAERNGTAPSVPAEPATASALADKLIAMCKTLSGAQRSEVVLKLADAGLAAGGGEVREVVKEVVREVPGAGGLPAAAVNELKKMLGVPPEGTVSAERVVDLAMLLSEFTIKLEPWACSYWKEIAPDAKTQIFRVLSKERPNERQGSLAKFVEGDGAVNKDTIARDILKLRSLVSLLLKGVLDAGKQFGKDHVARFSVEAVQSAAERGTFTESQAAKNWKQYVKLMEGYDAAAMEKRLKQLIAKDVDNGLAQVIR